MSIELRVADSSRPTGRLLRELLTERGVRVVTANGDALVSYGLVLHDNRPSLNGNAGRQNKLVQAIELAKEKVLTIKTYTPDEAAKLGQEAFPMLARQAHHRGGKDIKMCLQPEDVASLRRNGADFFTPFIPSTTEYRCWIFRGLHLGSYQKVLRYPEKYKKVGRNYDNGFAFELVQSENVPREAVDTSVDAVRALGLDFGAVDILAAKDGKYYVLEVNTAPGVEGRRQVIESLADKIANWEKNGYKRRNGDPANKDDEAKPVVRAVAIPRAEPARPVAARPVVQPVPKPAPIEQRVERDVAAAFRPAPREDTVERRAPVVAYRPFRIPPPPVEMETRVFPNVPAPLLRKKKRLLRKKLRRLDKFGTLSPLVRPERYGKHGYFDEHGHWVY